MTVSEMIRVLLIVTLGAAAGVALARNSPHGKEFFAENGGKARYSTSVQEDATLDVPGLVTKYGYPLEVHQVITPDGYILEMHRIPHGRDNNNVPGFKRPVVYLQHGLLSSSSEYVLMGPGKGLGYILAEEGYDVWMGNARGNYYSRRHITMNPDKNNDFWSFSWHEIGNIDLRAMIDYTLAFAGQERFHYIGFSQGTTSFFVLAAKNPEYNQKIISVQALAPVAFMSNLRSPLIRMMAPFADNLDTIMSILGMNEFMPNTQTMSWAGQTLCQDESFFQPICSNILFLIAGYNVDQLNSTMLPVIMGHTPAGASSKQLVHYGQGVNSALFRYFNWGTIRNLINYRTRQPPTYDLSRVTAPVFLHYSDNDWLAHVDDVDKLFRSLPNSYKFRVSMDSFNHLDFVWAKDVKTLLYDRVINLMKALE